jgi:hypothetical protein
VIIDRRKTEKAKEVVAIAGLIFFIAILAYVGGYFVRSKTNTIGGVKYRFFRTQTELLIWTPLLKIEEHFCKEPFAGMQGFDMWR